MKLKLLVASFALATLWAGGPRIAADTATSTPVAAADDSVVTLVDRRADRKVDVLIDGKPFTSYIYPAVARETGALPDSQRRRRARDARVSARSHGLVRPRIIRITSGTGSTTVTSTATTSGGTRTRPRRRTSRRWAPSFTRHPAIVTGADRGELDGIGRLEGARRFDAAARASAVRVLGRRRASLDRPHHHLDGRRQGRDVQRHQGRGVRHPRRACARPSVETA